MLDKNYGVRCSFERARFVPLARRVRPDYEQIRLADLRFLDGVEQGGGFVLRFQQPKKRRVRHAQEGSD